MKDQDQDQVFSRRITDMNRITVIISQKERYVVTDLPADYKFTLLECKLIDKMVVYKDDLLRLEWEKVNLWFYPDNNRFYLKTVIIGSTRFSMTVALDGKSVDIVVPLDKLLVVSCDVLHVLENELSPVLLYMRTNQTTGLPEVNINVVKLL